VKKLFWYAGSKKDFIKFPDEVKNAIGYQLHRVQDGNEPRDFKPLNDLGKGITGVYELRDSSDHHQYRVAYVAKFAKGVVVLHCFEKKTQKTLKSDLDLIAIRYRDMKEELS